MNWLRNFMMGRYGNDQLGLALLIVSLILGFLPFLIIRVISFALLGLAVFRMLSKNIAKRRVENEVFMRFWFKITYRFKNSKGRWQESKNFRRFNCPNCKQQVRVPKHKGKISITCPKCGTKFIKKV